MQTKYLSRTSSRPPSSLRKTGAIVATTAVAGVALMFSALLLTVLISIGTVMFAYLWWKTRAVRKQMREQMKNFSPPGATVEREVFRGETYAGEVIECEAIRVDAKRDTP